MSIFETSVLFAKNGTDGVDDKILLSEFFSLTNFFIFC